MFTSSFGAHRQAFLLLLSSLPSFQMSSNPLSADAPAFVPRAAAAAALPKAPLTFTVYRGLGAPNARTFELVAMASPRTASLESGPLSMIGLQVRGYEHPFDPAVLEDEHIVQGCHDNDYRLESILHPLPAVAAAPLGDFPKNIQDYFWINDGKNDEHPWYLLARLSNGTFVFLEASCTFSGFDCQGQIHLYAADSLQALYDHAMGEGARYRFACCFDKATREKVAADKAARAAAAAAARRPKVQRVPAHLRQNSQMQQARMLQAQQALQARYAAEARARIATEAQAQTAHDAAFKILEDRVKRWQAMSDSDHEREVERMEIARDRLRDKSGRY
jgi:hypothetical protein